MANRCALLLQMSTTCQKAVREAINVDVSGMLAPAEDIGLGGKGNSAVRQSQGTGELRESREPALPTQVHGSRAGGQVGRHSGAGKYRRNTPKLPARSQRHNAKGFWRWPLLRLSLRKPLREQKSPFTHRPFGLAVAAALPQSRAALPAGLLCARLRRPFVSTATATAAAAVSQLPDARLCV